MKKLFLALILNVASLGAMELPPSEKEEPTQSQEVNTPGNDLTLNAQPLSGLHHRVDVIVYRPGLSESDLGEVAIVRDNLDLRALLSSVPQDEESLQSFATLSMYNGDITRYARDLCSIQFAPITGVIELLRYDVPSQEISFNSVQSTMPVRGTILFGILDRERASKESSLKWVSLERAATEVSDDNFLRTAYMRVQLIVRAFDRQLRDHYINPQGKEIASISYGTACEEILAQQRNQANRRPRSWLGIHGLASFALCPLFVSAKGFNHSLVGRLSRGNGELAAILQWIFLTAAGMCFNTIILPERRASEGEFVLSTLRTAIIPLVTALAVSQYINSDSSAGMQRFLLTWAAAYALANVGYDGLEELVLALKRYFEGEQRNLSEDGNREL